jgi:hypothetical protein
MVIPEASSLFRPPGHGLATTFLSSRELGADGEDRGLVIWKAHALKQVEIEAVEERGLGGWMRASSSRMVRGELPSPARCCHISRLFQSRKARKQTRMLAWTLSSR